MKQTQNQRLHSAWLFAAAATVALVFALFTLHVWEDYYITYRSSRNLATGNGLVFNVGDRLHTFTSPLGVLLPALCSLLTGNTSDAAALWIFRALCISAFAGGVTLLWRCAMQAGYGRAAGLLALALIFDAKSLDFTINGMETAFMLLFLAYTLWAHLTPRPKQWVHLGAAWAGLMWTRPDSFIYIGLIAGGVWLFNPSGLLGVKRRDLLALYFRAGLLTTAIYGPWLVWAWWYYGTPIPHTIVAKGAQSGGLGAGSRLLHGFWQLPYLIWQGRSAAEGAFLPSYFTFPIWPVWMLLFGRVLATLSCVLWLIPKVRPEIRVASLAFYGACAYLSFVPYYPFPWYYPAPCWLAVFALFGALSQLWRTEIAWLRVSLGVVAAVVLAGMITLTYGVARQVRAQQHFVEDGNRRKIGEWLHEQAHPGDSVFMEPLGYIGYFSQLKTYDWPGMSSREVVEACRLVGTDWGDLILFLQPTWVVLRASGEGDMSRISPALNEISYERIHDFDLTKEILELDVPGRKFLEFDSHFVVYRRRYPTRHDADGFRICSPIGSSIRNIGDDEVRMVHAPGNMIIPLPASAKQVLLKYGFPNEAIAGRDPTDGADFEIWLVDGRERTRIHAQSLMPLTRPEDRYLHVASLPLPVRQHPKDAFLDLVTKPRASLSQDWTCWTKPEFR